MKNSFNKLSYDELVAKRDELRKSYLQMRMDKVLGHVDNPLQVRNARREVNDEIKKDKTIPEDLSKSYLEDIQKATDKAIVKIEEIAKAKQKEIMTI